MPKLPPWSSAPVDPALLGSTTQFLQWVQQSIADLQSATQNLIAPVLSVQLQGLNSAQLIWSSVSGASKFEIFESPISGAIDKPIATITANASLGHNTYLRKRVGLGIFYYSVRAVGADGQLGEMSNIAQAAVLPDGVVSHPIPSTPLRLNYFLTKDLAAPDPFEALDNQMVLFTVTQDAVGGHQFTWPSNMPVHGFVSGASFTVNIQLFIYIAANVQDGADPVVWPNGLLYPITSLITI